MPEPTSARLRAPRGAAAVRQLDESLIRALHQLLASASVSAAAAQLGMTQPAMSRQLRTLRQIVGDPLLVRVGNTMRLTPRAEALEAPVRRILADLALLPARTSFDPAQAQTRFRLASYDSLPAPFFAAMALSARAAAPLCEVEIHSLASTTETLRLLSEGELDALITTRRDLASHLHARLLLNDPVMCVVRRSHPLAAAPTPAVYSAAQHIGSLVQEPVSGGGLESRLREAGLRLHYAVRTQYLSLAQQLVHDADLVFTTGRKLALAMVAADPSLVALPVPVPATVEPLRYNLVWHERTHRDPAMVWFRKQVLDAARGLAD
jgi:DNA-binding transcriptional LysR family regulator